jgi:nitrite reductase/ring-hydroxylating ferredoxin subunit
MLMPLKLTLDGVDVLVCKDACGVFVVDELCPHQLKSMAYGIVMEGTLTCPHHQYRFDLETGRPGVRRCAPLKTYSVVVHDQQVWAKVT